MALVLLSAVAWLALNGTVLVLAATRGRRRSTPVRSLAPVTRLDAAQPGIEPRVA